MNELLGFVVLSGPLFLILIFLLVSIVGIIILGKKVTGTKKRLLGGLSIFGIAFFILFGDEIVGEMYLSYLCEYKTQMNVYETVELPSKYWNEDGSPKFINARGVLNTKILDKIFGWETKYEPYINTIINIQKRRWILKNNRTNQEVGEVVDFMRHFGWLYQFSPAPNSGEGCGRVLIKKYGKEKYFKDSANNKTDFLQKIFMKSSFLNKDK